MINRRDALKTIGGLAGAATLAKFLPACGNSGPDGITTYVFLMLENRTYDHVFGARSWKEGKPGDGLRDGINNPDMQGSPVALYEAPADALCVADPPHGWDASHLQFNNGAMDGFVSEYQKAHNDDLSLKDAMTYMTRAKQPVSWALADAYTSCDRWFCSVMGPTLPNRAYWHTATSFGLKNNNDVINQFASVPVPTIYNRLVDKGVDWAYYFGSLAVVSLLGNPGPYQLDLGPNDGTGHVRKFAVYADDPGSPSGQFFKDAAAGTLPPVVYIDPYFGSGGNDDHPPTHPIMAQALIHAVYTALAKSPQWKNCMLVITYDEHGGFYDHVPPPTTTDDTLAKFGVDGFEQLGFRVPAMVIGPYAKKGYVSSVQYDHTSALKHLQNTFGLETLNGRMDAANDLMDCIDLDRLARGEWEKPIDLPAINVADYPYQEQMCLSGEALRSHDPISEWADANPTAFGPDYDVRGDRVSYHRAIQEFLRRSQG